MSAQDPKPKYRDVRDLVVIRWKADIIRSSRGPNDPKATLTPAVALIDGSWRSYAWEDVISMILIAPGFPSVA